MRAREKLSLFTWLSGAGALARPKSSSFTPPRGEHDVAGLQVPVDDPALVGLVQGVGDLACRAPGPGPWAAGPREPLGEGLALEVLHDQEVDPLVLADVVEGADVGVGEGGDHLRLALEALLDLREDGQVLGQHLDGHRAVQAGVLGPIDLAHAAGAHGLFDLVRAELQSWFQRHPVLRSRAAVSSSRIRDFISKFRETAGRDAGLCASLLGAHRMTQSFLRLRHSLLTIRLLGHTFKCERSTGLPTARRRVRTRPRVVRRAFFRQRIQEIGIS